MKTEEDLQNIINNPEYRLLVEIRKLIAEKGKDNFSTICALIDCRYLTIRDKIKKTTAMTILTYNPDNNLVGQEPKKKVKKKPTGILKDLAKAEKIDLYLYSKDGTEKFIRWSDVEKIIKKYS